MSRYSKISALLTDQLYNVQPSEDWGMQYRPCLVTLRNDQKLDCVYVVPEDPYIRIWGVHPEEDSGKRYLAIDEVLAIEDSPSRLPLTIANQIYEAEESGMGYCVFTLEFSDGGIQAYVTGNAVDFVPMPNGKLLSDIVSVHTHTDRNAGNILHGLEYYWCIYDGTD